MNTVAKGDPFEAEVFDLFSSLLSSGQLFFSPESCKMYRKKGYFSKDRGTNIVVDISIEVYLPGATEWSILTVIEAKNYSHSVPVDDVEEFDSKLSQITGQNVKGILATSFSFQRGAITFARSRGIALVKIASSREVFWEIKKRPTEKLTAAHLEKAERAIERALIDESYFNPSIRCYAYVAGVLLNSMHEVVRYLYHDQFKDPELATLQRLISAPTSNDVPSLPFLTTEQIEALAYELLEKIAPGTSTTPRETPVERLIEHISISQGVGFDFGKDLGVDSRGLMILGKLTADPLSISVSTSIGGDLERSRFTVVHEIGHVILGHMTYFARETFSAWQYDSMESLLGFEKLIERMEVQANRYAAFTLMPRNAFITQTILATRALKISRKTQHLLYIDDQRCNIDNYYAVTSWLKRFFKVSRKAVEYHLKNLDLLEDHRRYAT